MKKALFTFLLLFAATSMSAQTIVKGDMNDDNELTITDAVSVVDVILGKSPKQTISLGGDPYMVDNTLVVGTWKSSGGTSFTLNEDGTTSYLGAANYKFRPYQGTLTLYDASQEPFKAITVNDLTSSYLTVVENGTFTKYIKTDGHEYVDLGLPSGTLWATCNVGASSPEECGDYFAWGETVPYTENGKTVFDWSTYKWCDGVENTLTKYCTVSSYGFEGMTDNLLELNPEDDAAFVNWGPNWRMPTDEQFRELLNSDYTTNEWTSQNGIYGRLFTSKRNNKSVFLPATGAFFGDYFTGGGSTYSDGYYLARTIYQSSPDNAWGLTFHSGSINIGGSYRCNGQGVRPVRASK